MDPTGPPPRLSTYASVQRMSEPWALERSLAIAITLVLAMVLGHWVASGKFEFVILTAVWFTGVFIIVFVQDYWWSPPLIITALSFTTSALSFPLSGMEIGVVILCITFPIKIAMKTLRKAQPEMSPGVFYWALLVFVAAHAICILFYSKIEEAPGLQNIVKSYYQTLTPLIFYGLLVRYCAPYTVRLTVIYLFFISLFVVVAGSFTVLANISVDPFTDLQVSVGWLDSDDAIGILRIAGPYLLVGGLAFWPNFRSGPVRMLLAIAIFIGLFGTLVSASRAAMAQCVAAGIFYAVVRRKLWLAFPFVIFTALISAVITTEPNLLYNLPESVQRTLEPLNFSSQKTEIQEFVAASNDWHSELRTRSLDYWMWDTNSFWLGRGYKGWDPSIHLNDPTEGVTTERVLELAIEMGKTENMFSSITNIFGLTGLILYALFLGNLAWELFKGYRLAPAGTDARALCEFSLISLLVSLVFFFLSGGVPGLVLIYWQLGILAARPMLAGGKPAPAPAVKEIPSFARPAFAQQGSAFRTQ